MNNREYKRFETPFLEVAKPLLAAMSQALANHGFDDLSEIVHVDHDVSRGLGFGHATDDELYVELMLEDGGEHGYEGVAPILNCSAFMSGQVWAPFNFTEEVGITDPAAIAARFELFDPEEVAFLVAREWTRVQGERQSARETA